MIRKLRQGIGGLFYGWRPKVIRNHPGHHELLLPLGTCVGRVITGAIYDRYHSYAPMMSTFIALALIASCLYTLLVSPSLPSRWQRLCRNPDRSTSVIPSLARD